MRPEPQDGFRVLDKDIWDHCWTCLQHFEQCTCEDDDD